MGWGIENTSNMLWVGPMRPDGTKVDDVVVGLSYDADLTHAAKVRQQQRARLIAAAPDLATELAKALDDLWDDRHSHQDRPSFERDYASAFAALEKAGVA